MSSQPILRRSLATALVPIAPSLRVLHRVSPRAAFFRNHFQRGRSFPSPAFRIAVGPRACIFIVVNNLSRLFAALQRRTCRTLISYFRWDMVTSLRSPRACTARSRPSADHTGENVLDNLDIQ
jgi:hypothetical protein